MPYSQSLIAELEAALSHGSGSQRFTILRRVTDLFLSHAESCSDDHVAVFDDVMSRLIEQIERQALIELSGRLAPVDNAPTNVIGRLSRDDDIAVSGPVLEKSNVLTDHDLLEIAETKSQTHLSAIAGRARISEAVTDVLVGRGNSEVATKVTANAGARFSKVGLAKVVGQAEQDENLAVAVVNRGDVPPEMFNRLVRMAAENVRQRMLANATPEMRERITQVLSVVSAHVARIEARRTDRGGARTILRQQDPVELRTRISQSAQAHQTADVIEALAMLCEVPVNAVKNVVRQGSEEGMLVLGKAGGIGWPEMEQVLNAIMPSKTETPGDVKKLFEKFLTLSGANAQRVIRFIKTSKAASSDDIKKLI